MVQENVLDKIDSDRLAVNIVWTPVLASDNRESVEKARETVTDKRATHFWDADQSLGNSFGRIVELPNGRSLAWDVFFVFNDATKWEESEGPEPDDWAHQLGQDERRLMDGDKLREAVKRLLEGID